MEGLIAALAKEGGMALAYREIWKERMADQARYAAAIIDKEKEITGMQARLATEKDADRKELLRALADTTRVIQLCTTKQSPAREARRE
jgi:hypothetical protein